MRRLSVRQKQLPRCLPRFVTAILVVTGIRQRILVGALLLPLVTNRLIFAVRRRKGRPVNAQPFGIMLMTHTVLMLLMTLLTKYVDGIVNGTMIIVGFRIDVPLVQMGVEVRQFALANAQILVVLLVVGIKRAVLLAER